MKLTIVLKKQDALGLGGQILEAMGMHRSIYEPEVFVVQHVQDPRLVAPVDVLESMWSVMYLEALMDEGIKPLRVYQKDNSTASLTPLYASTGGRGLSRTAVADMLDAAADALDAGCGCEEGTCQCGADGQPDDDGYCENCGLPVGQVPFGEPAPMIETIEMASPPEVSEAMAAAVDALALVAEALEGEVCECGEACEPGPDGNCMACGLPMAETIENALLPEEGEDAAGRPHFWQHTPLAAPNVMNEIVETAPLNAGKVSADSPEPMAILSALGKIPGVVSADQSDSWRESDGVYWYNCTLKLEPTIRKSAKAYRNGPIIQVVTDFKNKPLSVAKAAKKAVEAAGGYNVQVSTPNRKKAWVDPEFPRDESEASSYFENGAAVLVEFLWQPGEASASVHPAVANAIKALGAVADMLEAEADDTGTCECGVGNKAVMKDADGNCQGCGLPVVSALDDSEPEVEVADVEGSAASQVSAAGKAPKEVLDLMKQALLAFAKKVGDEKITEALKSVAKPEGKGVSMAKELQNQLGHMVYEWPSINQSGTPYGSTKALGLTLPKLSEATLAWIEGANDATIWTAARQVCLEEAKKRGIELKRGDLIAKTVKAAAPVFDKKTWKVTREKANDALEKAGFDGNGRFRNVGQANSKLAEVLSNFGLQIGDVMSADRFREDSRTQNFNLELVNEDDSFSPVAFDDSTVHYSYTKLSPDRVEVVAYLS